jgi:cytochrome c-type biogenesis protein
LTYSHYRIKIVVMTDITVLLVFGAGLLSFLSPCVLPLIPSYLSILGGVGLDAPKGKAPEENPSPAETTPYRPRLIRASLCFVLGFSAVFMILSVLVSATFSLMGGISKYINWAAGLIVIILGLNVIFDFISFLNYEKRIHPAIRGTGGAFIAGAAFGAGWTPCIGPILTSILLLAGQTGKTGTAVLFLGVYSLGLALPFLLAAVFFNSFLKHASKIRSALPLIRRCSGVLLVIIGIMILTGKYSALNILIQRLQFSYIAWAETKALPLRLLARWLAWLQTF